VIRSIRGTNSRAGEILLEYGTDIGRELCQRRNAPDLFPVLAEKRNHLVRGRPRKTTDRFNVFVNGSIGKREDQPPERILMQANRSSGRGRGHVNSTQGERRLMNAQSFRWAYGEGAVDSCHRTYAFIGFDSGVGLARAS
jgi:hypothetical protein